MVAATTADTDHHRDELFEALANERRRAILRRLRRTTEARPTELAIHLIAAERDEPPADVTRAAAEQVQVELEHVHLPKLADANLVAYADGVVTITRHPALQDPAITALLETPAPERDAVLASLADRHRRIALSVLVRNGETMDRTDLATAVTETVQDGGSEVTVEAVLLELYHVHLPKLAAADLVAHDADEGTVTYEGHPELDERWLAADVDADASRAVPSMAEQ